MTDDQELIAEARKYIEPQLYPPLVSILTRLTDALETAAVRYRAEGWWEGVNDQWKHRPVGNRVLESANPYRALLDENNETQEGKP